jgi:hypothetical protein
MRQKSELCWLKSGTSNWIFMTATGGAAHVATSFSIKRVINDAMIAQCPAPPYQ